MNALKVDFCRSRGTPRWLAPALLALALAFAGDVGFSFLKTVRSISKNEKALASMEPRTYNTKTARKVAPEEMAAARETMQRLSTPWDKLFSALETAASDQVALLSIEPDPKAGKVMISGDGKDYLAALTYVLNLGRSDSLSHVELARHEVKQNDPQKPVTFSVSAAWGK
jgi:hypothetical protein